MISDRKQEQVELATAGAGAAGRSAGWEDVQLVPVSLPELRLDEIDTRVSVLGHRLSVPVVIVGMTGGHARAAELNAVLGAVAETLGLAVGVGSQRAALGDPSLASTYSAIRRDAPSAMVIANLGVCQLVSQGGEQPVSPAGAKRAVEMVDAQALAVHLNVLEETVQPEGDAETRGLSAALQRLCDALDVPVVAKETGSGMSRETARLLASCGVGALDVGGSGGTSFAGIESVRAARQGDDRRARLGATFADWGIPTAASLVETRDVGPPVIATGGIRTGLDAAKAIALGATTVGVGRPALTAAERGFDAALEEMSQLVAELRLAMLLCGAADVAALRRTDTVLTGFTGQWVTARQVPDRRTDVAGR